MFLAPRKFPPLWTLLDAIPASRADVAQHLGVTRRTLMRWEADETAPHAVLVAVFMESAYGRSAIDADMQREVVNLRGLSRSLRDREDVFRHQIARLENEWAAAARGDAGAANGPVFAVG